MFSKRRRKKFVTVLVLAIVIAIGAFNLDSPAQHSSDDDISNLPAPIASPAAQTLQQLPIKGRAPKTGYERSQFGNGWNTIRGCDVRNLILQRDLTNVTFTDSLDGIGCLVATGTLNDPYSGKVIQFIRGATTSDDIQIDHVVALSDAWQKGAQQLTPLQRNQLANDPLNLLAVDGPANQAKGDGDAATWLPANKAFRCQYGARQVAVKHKYSLWVTRPEYNALYKIFTSCPEQTLPR